MCVCVLGAAVPEGSWPNMSFRWLTLITTNTHINIGTGTTTRDNENQIEIMSDSGLRTPSQYTYIPI